jgi:hypothetical protein
MERIEATATLSSEQYSTEKNMMIHYSPAPMPTVWDPVVFLSTVYYQQVFSRAYMLVHPSMMDRVIPVINNDDFAQNSICLLASTFLMQKGENVSFDYRNQLVSRSEYHLPATEDFRRPVSLGMAFGALQLISNSLFAAGVHPWKKHLRIAFNYVYPILFNTPVCRLDPSSLFISQITGWFCVLAAISNEFDPEYLRTFTALFDPANYVDDYANRYMNMPQIMGADCRVLWALAEITDLAQTKPDLTEYDMSCRGTKIQKRLMEAWVPYPECEHDTNSINAQRWFTGELFRQSAFLYYYAIIHNHNPYDEAISQCVDSMINLIACINPSSITSRMCVFAIFLCGALYRTDVQRAFLEYFLNEACAENVGNSRAVLDVLREIWDERERDPFGGCRVNWRDPLKRKRLLLV